MRRNGFINDKCVDQCIGLYMNEVKEGDFRRNCI
jgi:hypothetical protein